MTKLTFITTGLKQGLLIFMLSFFAYASAYAQENHTITAKEATEIAINEFLRNRWTVDSIGSLRATYYKGMWVVQIGGDKASVIEGILVTPAHATILITEDGKDVYFIRGV